MKNYCSTFKEIDKKTRRAKEGVCLSIFCPAISSIEVYQIYEFRARSLFLVQKSRSYGKNIYQESNF